jgi:hypothetical protein
MKNLYFFLVFILLSVIFLSGAGGVMAQSVTIDPKNTANGIINAQSNNKGIVLPSNANPTMNIVAPSAGTMVYNSNSQTPNFYNGSAWQSVAAPTTTNMGYKNMAVYPAGTFTWTVPAGVSKIYVEGWGGGGGGRIYFSGTTFINLIEGNGGAAGSFGYRIMEVTQGEVYSIVVGKGGAGDPNLGYSTTGGATSLSLGFFTAFYCDGGRNDGYLNSPPAISGYHGLVQGENGHGPEISVSFFSQTEYVQNIKLGDGGSAYNGGKGGLGSHLVFKTGNLILATPILNKNGGIPGGGGAAAYPAYNANYGGNGGDGKLIIHY